MPDRLERIFRIGCIALAVLLVLRLALAVQRATTLHNVTIPALPRLAATPTNEPASATNQPVASGSTNQPTNSIQGTNQMAGKTNAIAGTNFSKIAASAKPTNSVVGAGGPGSPSFPKGKRGKGGPGPQDDLPAPVKKQVDRIVESEILAPFVRPMPAALLGIADDEAFVRASNGQTGAVKEGASLGPLKLLRIGVNRVLVEEDGEKKELMVFDGAGGKSLMPPETNAALPPTNNQTANLNPQLKRREKP